MRSIGLPRRAPRADRARRRLPGNTARARATRKENSTEGGRQFINLVGSVITPFAALTGLLYYFGWVRTGALFGYFGIEQKLLGYTSQDYLLRSAGVAFRPTAVAALLALAAIVTFRLLATIAQIGRLYRIGSVLVCIAAAIFCLAGGLGVLLGVTMVFLPSTAAIATIVGGVGLEAAARISPVDVAVGGVAARRTVVTGLVAVGCFWSCTLYAQQSGIAVAAAWEATPGSRPSAIVYARSDLDLHGPGVLTESFPASDQGFRYRYSGLRLLIFSNGRWFLIPAGWRHDNGAPTIVLAEGDGIRVETTSA